MHRGARINKHKQLRGIIQGTGGGQIVCVSWGKRETHKQNSQEISGKGRHSRGIIPGQYRENFVYVFSCYCLGNVNGVFQTGFLKYRNPISPQPFPNPAPTPSPTPPHPFPNPSLTPLQPPLPNPPETKIQKPRLKNPVKVQETRRGPEIHG